MKPFSKRALQKQREQEFRAELNKLCLERLLECPNCGIKFTAITDNFVPKVNQDPSGIMECECGANIDVPRNKGVYVDFSTFTVLPAERIC